MKKHKCVFSFILTSIMKPNETKAQWTEPHIESLPFNNLTGVSSRPRLSSITMVQSAFTWTSFRSLSLLLQNTRDSSPGDVFALDSLASLKMAPLCDFPPAHCLSLLFLFSFSLFLSLSYTFRIHDQCIYLVIWREG